MLRLHASTSVPNFNSLPYDPSSDPPNDLLNDPVAGHKKHRTGMSVSLDDEYFRNAAGPADTTTDTSTWKPNLRKRHSLDLAGRGRKNRSAFSSTLHVVTERLKSKIGLTKRSMGYSSLHEDECMCKKQQVYGESLSPKSPRTGFVGQACRVHYHISEAGRQTGKTNPME